MDKFEIPAFNEDATNNAIVFKLHMLAKLKMECDYYLGEGNCCKETLWFNDVNEQIAEMKSIWTSLSAKPEWISLEDIENYETKMK